MHSKAKAATKAEKRRWDAMREIGCICCWQDGRKRNPAQVNHHLDGGVRMGHSFTTAECPWHHDGIPPGELTKLEATDYYGPSRRHDKKEFHRRYGTDAELLSYQNTLLASAGFKG